MLLRGSEWRRWDLHVHTPETALNDQFGSWEEYLKTVEANRNVKVIGVTDYMTITNYSKLKTFKAQGRVANIDLLLPNIEFRIAPPTDKATAVNIHLLVSPEDPNHEQEIVNALGRLTWRYNSRNYSCLPDQLIALGGAFNRGAASDRDALAVGVTQFKVEFAGFRDWYNSEPWLQQHSIAVVEAGNNGLSGFHRDGAWGGYREEITRFAQALFSGRPGEREFWLGRTGSAEDRETVMRLGGPKPCLHGSDAHEIAKLFKPDQDRFCWIKADTTFEGLRQVLFEPADRVHIGPTAPVYHDEARTIRAVRLTDSNGWFNDTEIPLNQSLVSIIGQKGSGKSALAELISYAAGSWVNEESGSFLRRAGDRLEGMTIELLWADGSRSKARLGEEQSDDAHVRYLSQRFVERLCADDHIGAELIHEIEAVIFSYIDPTDTLNASNFDELRSLRTAGIKSEGERLREEIVRLIREEWALRANEQKLPEKRARIKALAEEREGLQKQLPQATSAEEAKIQSDLQTKRQAMASMQQLVATDKQKLQKIADIKTRVTAFKAQIARFYTELAPLLKEIGLSEGEQAAFRPEFPEDTNPPLARREGSINTAISQREGDPQMPALGTIRALQAEIDALTKQESADKARQLRVRTIQTRIAAIDTETTRISAEIAQIEGPDKERRAAANRERNEVYVGYFENLLLEHETLEQLYAPVTAKLQAESASVQERDLAFSIKWEADLPAWLLRGGELFDQRRAIPYGNFDELAKQAGKVLVPAWTSGDPTKIKPAMETFLAEFRKPEPKPANYLRTGKTIQDVLEWLYEVRHVRLTYGLKYNGVDLEKLSPGTKGIVLLILYLGMDLSDTRPLIVDQPDENLDNESIYELLTAYFKSAKARRQIVLITHNPNLVVNADSEQVVVATATRREDGLPTIGYHAGALENTSANGDGIRQHVCRILEGGADAFRKRERRYALTQQ